MIPELKGCRVSWHRQLTRVWPRLPQPVLIVATGPGILDSVKHWAHIKQRAVILVTNIFKINFCCPPKMRPLASKLSSVGITVSLSGAWHGGQLWALRSQCVQDIGSTLGAAHNEHLHRSSQWPLHYRWQTEQSVRRECSNNNSYWVSTCWKQTSSELRSR